MFKPNFNTPPRNNKPAKRCFDTPSPKKKVEKLDEEGHLSDLAQQSSGSSSLNPLSLNGDGTGHMQTHAVPISEVEVEQPPAQIAGNPGGNSLSVSSSSVQHPVIAPQQDQHNPVSQPHSDPGSSFFGWSISDWFSCIEREGHGSSDNAEELNNGFSQDIHAISNTY